LLSTKARGRNFQVTSQGRMGDIRALHHARGSEPAEGMLMEAAHVLDGHIHLTGGHGNPSEFGARQAASGIEGGLVISLPPACFGVQRSAGEAAERLEHLLEWCEGGHALFPFFWIDPLEPDAVSQVETAVSSGAAGFKVICSRHRPGDPAALEVYRAAAAAGKPVLFHSGILWDGQPSSPFNRPAEFEALLEVPGLRFALAHISWPWCDELLAVYGKMLNACTEHGAAVEMYIDTTPGTPPIYRREALTKLFTIGYDVRDRVIFGTDGLAEDYNSTWARTWLRRDLKILEELEVGQDTVNGVFGGNLRRFVGSGTSADQER